MLTQIKLVDGSREMILRPRDGIAHVSLDMGFPGVREVSENRADDDGADDTTAFHGASAVSLTLTLYQGGTTREIIDELRSYCHPRQRPYLVVSDDEWAGGDRRIQLRVDQQTAVIESGKGATRDIQAGWKAPAGEWEAVDELALTVTADIPSSVGRSYPLVSPRVYEATLSSGTVETVNIGGTDSHLIARLYGPCSAPTLINDVTGERLAFTSGLELGPGEYVEVSTKNKTVYFLSDVTQSRLGNLDFDTSTWWQLTRGLNRLRYTGTDTAAGSQAIVYYRPVWL